MHTAIPLAALASLLLLASAVHALDQDPHLDVTTTLPPILYTDQNTRGNITITCDGAYPGVMTIMVYLADSQPAVAGWVPVTIVTPPPDPGTEPSDGTPGPSTALILLTLALALIIATIKR